MVHILKQWPDTISRRTKIEFISTQRLSIRRSNNVLILLGRNFFNFLIQANVRLMSFSECINKLSNPVLKGS